MSTSKSTTKKFSPEVRERGNRPANTVLTTAN
jgi:hypothetical protein